MSIKKKSNESIKALQHTLAVSPHIEQVHFTESGDHYFATHEFTPKGSKKVKLYGKLKSEPVLKKVQGTREIYKIEPVETPEAEIIETLTRAEILAIELKDSETLSKKDQKVVDKLQAENEALKAKLKEAGIE